MAEGMSVGTVVSFYGRNGYGFIRPEGCEEDVFVHHSEIKTDGYRTLREGQKVKFLVAEKDGRTKAVTVTPIDKLNVKRNRKKRNNVNGNGNVVGVECYNCGGIGHLARDCSSPRVVINGGGVGNGAGDRSCFRCGVVGHIARDCTWEEVVDDRKCYTCGEAGHMARDCTSKSNGVGGKKFVSDRCYNCNKVGHFARDCPNSNAR